MRVREAPKKITIVLLFFVLLLIAAQVIAATLPMPRARVDVVDVVRQQRSDGLPTGIRVAEIHYSIRSGSFDFPVRIIATSGISPWQDQDVYVYYSNPDFRRFGSSVPHSAIVAGLLEDLRSEASLRHLKRKISLVGPEGISHVLEQVGAVLVVPTKVWAWNLDPVPDRSAVIEWVKRGGTLMIVGRDRLLGELMPSESGMPLNIQSVGSWRPGDANGSGKAILRPVTNGHKALSWSYRDTRVAGNGAWITHRLANPLSLGSESNRVYLRFQLRVSSGQSLELLYIDLRDAKGNFRQYYIDSKPLPTAPIWKELLVPLDDADRASEKPADLQEVVSLSVVAKLKNATTSQYMEIILSDVSLERGPAAMRIGSLSSLLEFQCGAVESNSSALLSHRWEPDSEQEGAPQANSFTAYRLGRGRVLQFGEGITPVCTESQVAHDLMQLIQAGALLDAVRYATAYHDIPPATEVKGELRVAFQRDPLSVMVFSRDPYHLFYRLYEQRGMEAQ
jgi:hypothetical protein